MIKRKLIATPIIPIPEYSENIFTGAPFKPEENHSYVIAHNLGVIALRLGKIAEMLNDRL